MSLLPSRCATYNLLTLVNCGSNFKSVISKHPLLIKFLGIALRCLPINTCHVVRQQAVTWAIVNPNLYRHNAPLGYNEITALSYMSINVTMCFFVHSDFLVHVHLTDRSCQFKLYVMATRRNSIHICLSCPWFAHCCTLLWFSIH